MNKHTRGFTLIELMVVISIIGMLSSVVIVSLQAARDKGRVASGLKFSTYNYRAFGADAAGQWNFNEASGGNALDISGNNRHLTQSTGAALSRNSDTPNNVGGQSLPITNGGRYATVSIPSGQRPLLGNATLSAWIKVTGNGTGAIVAANNNTTGDTPLIIYITNIGGGVYLVHCTTDLPGSPGSTRDIGYISLNKWTHFACAINAQSGVLRGYMDGVAGANNGFIPSAPMYVDTMSVGGASQSSPFPFNIPYTPTYTGFIDDAAVYMQTLTASEIQHIYAQGAAQHGLALDE